MRGGKDPDEVPEPPKKPISKPGDLWILGKHRLLCGDANSQTDMERLADGAKPVLLATDPPYGVDYQGGSGNAKKRDKIEGDASSSIYRTFLPVALGILAKDAAIFLWYAGSKGLAVYQAFEEAEIQVRNAIIWRKLKPHFGAYMAHYKQDHEPCLFGARGKPPFFGPTDQRAVWEIEQPTKNELHPTQKPVELFEIPIRNHTRPGQAVLEPFAGSGTQIIAAEKTGRRCFALEIEPLYVDVAVARWEAFTGKKARRE
jgi:DNA modification methylase